MDCASASVSIVTRCCETGEKMETKLINAKLPRGRASPPAATAATRAASTSRRKTKMTAAGMKAKPPPKATMNAVVTLTRHPGTTTHQAGVDAGKPKTRRRGSARRTPPTITARSKKPRPAKSPAAKPKMAAAVLQSVAKPRRGGKTAGKPVSRAVVAKVAGMRTPPKTMRTVKKGTVQKTRVRVVCSSSVLRRRHEYIYLPCSLSLIHI